MGGRMVDVDGLRPSAVVLAAATQPAYGDTPADRLALLRGWLAAGDVEPAEIGEAYLLAQCYHQEDPEDDEAARAVVLLPRVLR